MVIGAGRRAIWNFKAKASQSRPCNLQQKREVTGAAFFEIRETLLDEVRSGKIGGDVKHDPEGTSPLSR